jgi:predicted DNA-binding mobile mystery protein A
METEKQLRARRELDETILAFRIARRAAADVDGWVRTVRQVVGVTAEELGRRMGVKQREVFRLESAEMSERIGLRRLRRAADALGCDLIYALVPREGTLEEMAAQQKEIREDALTLKRLDKDLLERRIDKATRYGATALQRAARRVLRKMYGIRIRKRQGS